MKRQLGILPAIWMLALLLLPAIAWLTGSRQAELENRSKTNRPTLTADTVRQKETFDQFDAFVRDRLPLRETALNVRGRILVDFFNVSTNPQVALGSNGWLYFTPELDNCPAPPGGPGSDPADAIEALAQTLVASGRGTTVAVAPSKILIHTADLPPLDADRLRCQSTVEKKVQQRLARTPGGVDLMTSLLEMEAAGNPPYLRNDTHWNWRGRALWTRLLLDGVQPGLADEVALKTVPLAERKGDLGAMLGMTRTEPDRIIEAGRAPTTPPKPEDYLIVGDSQTGSALLDPSRVGTPISESVLPGVWVCGWDLLAQGSCDDALTRSKRAVFEIVGRDFLTLNNTCWRPIAILAQDLRGEPGRWEADDSATTRANSLTVPDEGTVTVRVRPAGGDRTSAMRLVRIPVRQLGQPADEGGAGVTLTQKPINGPAAPCVTPEQTVEGGALFMPIPADRRASDLVLELSAPPGTRIGRPEEIAFGVNRAAAER